MAGRIVVGVDDSEGSATALRWALAEAELRGASVDVVHAWHFYPYTGDVTGMASYAIPYQDLEKSARQVLDRSVDRVHPVPTGVQVEPILVNGAAANVLLDVAQGADLLVVGSRGRDGFAGLLLGSVSQKCASHSPCPTVIIPHDEPTSDA